jgi:hypothetical protein
MQWIFVVLPVPGILGVSLSTRARSDTSGTASPCQLTESHDTCLVLLTGDVNIDGVIAAGDIIYLLNFVFLRGFPPEPCAAAGDVNCNLRITRADVLLLVDYLFRSGPAPCDDCTLIPVSDPCH